MRQIFRLALSGTEGERVRGIVGPIEGPLSAKGRSIADVVAKSRKICHSGLHEEEDGGSVWERLLYRKPQFGTKHA